MVMNSFQQQAPGIGFAGGPTPSTPMVGPDMTPASAINAAVQVGQDFNREHQERQFKKQIEETARAKVAADALKESGVLNELDLGKNSGPLKLTEDQLARVNANPDGLGGGFDEKALNRFGDKIKSISAAIKQGTTSETAAQLQIETELKKAINFTPGFAPELRQLAREAVGFDPTGMAMRQILGIKAGERNAEDAGQKALFDMYKKGAEEYLSDGLGRNIIFMPDGVTPDNKTMFELNQEKRYKERLIKQQQAESQGSAIVEKNNVIEFSDNLNQLLNYTGNFEGVVGNLVSTIQTTEEWQQTMPELKKQGQLIKSALVTRIEREYAGLNVSGDLAKFKEEQKQNDLKRVESMFSILDEENFDLVKQRQDSLKLIQTELELDFIKSNEALASLSASLGKGFINGMIPIVLSGNPEIQDQVVNAIGNAFKKSGKDVKAENLGSLIQVLRKEKPLNNMDPSEKKKILSQSYQVTKSFFDRGNIDRLDEQSQNTLGASVATLLQGFDEAQGNTENTRRALPLLTSPGFIGFVNNFDKYSDGSVKKEMVADSALTVLQRYITKPSDGAIVSLNSNLSRIKSLAASDTNGLVTFDRTTGLLALGGSPKYRTSQNDIGNFGFNSRAAVGLSPEYKEIKSIVDNVNRSVDTIYELRGHNPETKDLTKQQLAQFLIEDAGLIDKNLVRITGERKEIDFKKIAQGFNTDPVQAQEQRRVTLEEQTQNAVRRMEDFRILLQNNNAPQELLDQINQFQQQMITSRDSNMTQQNGDDSFINSTINTILNNEGGFQNNPNDSGNIVDGKVIGTNMGITPKTLAKYRKVPVSSITEQDIKNITEDEAREIYKNNYIIKPGLNRLPDHIRDNVIDMGVNAGQERAIMLLQKRLGLKQTGIVDEQLINASKKLKSKDYSDERINYYKDVVSKNPKKQEFLDGWIDRANKFI